MKNFCVLPWYSREIQLAKGTESVCCWLTGKPNIDDLKKDILADTSPSACIRCRINETKGLESRRQMENRFLDFAIDRDLTKIKEDVQQGKFESLLLQIHVGTLCNSTCVTCGSNASTSWQALENNQRSIKIESSEVDKNFESIKNSIDWKNVKRINLLGGEPLLIRKSFDILNCLLEVNNTNCLISFVTNGSVKLNSQQKDLLEKFTNIQCCVSIDGIGKMFEYVRYPLKWNTLLDNLEQYKTVFDEVVVSFTVSNLNYHARLQIISWFNEHNLLYIENYVQYPEYFNYQVQPGHRLWQEFVKQVRYQDSIKKISISDYIPEIAILMDKE